MIKDRKGRENHTLQYPSHVFQPMELLSFIEMEGFYQDLKDLGLDDDDLSALQVLIMSNPKIPPVIPGTGGLRKIRFAPAGWRRGKRGAARVCYVYFEDYGIVLLVVAYRKNEKDDLSADEKKAIRNLIRHEEEILSKGPIK